jgi:hypothetical protein
MGSAVRSNEVRFIDDAQEVEIVLTQDQVTRVDADIWHKITKGPGGKWCAAWSPGVRSFYCVRTVLRSKRQIQMHRVVLELSGHDIAGFCVDHINHDTLDNRLRNLRLATNQENARNQRKHLHCNGKQLTSAYKGVCWSKSANKWEARIKINRKRKTLGYFDSELEAAEAYETAAALHFGEFALGARKGPKKAPAPEDTSTPDCR